jgi:predicted RNA-binding Zn-ribbon protein involved in translation (DUF1610 family)
MTTQHALTEYLLRLADSDIILAQRLCEWIGNAPALEEEMALGNVALDLIGQARSWLEYAAELQGEGCSADDLSFGRNEREYRNLLTTDWISESGRNKLRDFGIAPPVGSASKRSLLGEEPVIACPQCGSEHTERVSEFGSTACKALYRCSDCLEPFDYFKCI